MRPIPKAIPDDDDDDYSQNKGFEVDEEYGKRLLHNKNREDLQRHEEMKKRGLINDDDDSEEDSEPDSEPDDDLGNPESDLKFVDLLLKVKKKDSSIRNSDVNFFESDESSEEDGVDKKDKKKKKKKKKMYLKDVQAQQLLEVGPEYDEEDEESKISTYAERQEELRRAVTDAMEDGENESDEEDDLLRVADKDEDDVEVDEELAKKMDEYFGEEAEVFENQFLKEYLVKQLWKEKDEKSVDEAELEELDEDEEALEMQEDYETNYRHEENAGEIVMGQSRIVEGSVRKKENARKAQRKNKEERMKMAEIERKEELKRLKNVKKKEMKEKMKKVLSVAGFKDGEECSLDAKDFDHEFDPEEYDKMMKVAFDDKYYGAEDSDLDSDEDEVGEKPDFHKEDELLGLPKDWHVIQGGDGFIAAREKVLKQKEKVFGDDVEEEEEEEEEEAEEEEKEEVGEEKEAEGKRKRKQKTSLIQRAKEALMDEYYKLDYEDTIGDLKTRFKYAKVQPNRYELETEEILTLDDTELNQYVPLKKMAPYVEKDWEVNRHKVKEQKLKIKELLQGIHNEKRSEKRKKSGTAETKPTQKADEEGEAEMKLSRKAKRRRRQAEKKLPPNRMAAYGKA